MKYKITFDNELICLLPTFLKRKKEELSLLRFFLNKKEFKEIESIGHKLLGNSGSYGFMELGMLGKMLMLKANKKDEDGINKIIIEIELYVYNIEETLNLL